MAKEGISMINKTINIEYHGAVDITIGTSDAYNPECTICSAAKAQLEAAISEWNNGRLVRKIDLLTGAVTWMPKDIIVEEIPDDLSVFFVEMIRRVLSNPLMFYGAKSISASNNSCHYEVVI